MAITDYIFEEVKSGVTTDKRSETVTQLKKFALEKYPELLINTKSNTKELKAQEKEYLSRAETLNQEFSERYIVTGENNPLPFFAINQDILLYMFSFTYLFLVLTASVYVSRLTESTAKGLFLIPLGGIFYVLFLGFLIQFG